MEIKNQSYYDWCRELVRLLASKISERSRHISQNQKSELTRRYIDRKRDRLREWYDDGMTPVDAVYEIFDQR